MSKRRSANQGILKQVEVEFYPVDPEFIARLPKHVLRSMVHVSLSTKRRLPLDMAIPISPDGPCIGWVWVTRKRPKTGMYPVLPSLVDLKIKVSNISMDYIPREINAKWQDHHKGVFLYLKALIDGTIEEAQRLVIVHGPPGSGKTYMLSHISYIAHKKGWNIYRPPRSSILSSYISETARNISTLFEKAVSETNKDRKGLIVLDELDSLAARRQDFDSGSLLHALETVNAICTEIDNLGTQGDVWVITTTNLLELIDEAVISRATVLPLDLPSKNAIKELAHDLSKDEKEEEKILHLLSETEKPSYRDVSKAFQVMKLEKTIGCNPFKSEKKEKSKGYIR